MSSETRKVFLFLDDIKDPKDANESFSGSNLLLLIKSHVQDINEYETVVVRDQYEFSKFLRERGIPDIVSFDFYLNYKIYDNNITGDVCAGWLAGECRRKGVDFPRYYVHSSEKKTAKKIVEVIEAYENN